MSFVCAESGEEAVFVFCLFSVFQHSTSFHFKNNQYPKQSVWEQFFPLHAGQATGSELGFAFASNISGEIGMLKIATINLCGGVMVIQRKHDNQLFIIRRMA